jgi:UDP-N-acetylmuramoyl-L-alanyl-D-glutamate--2,6-diaminopimelate ligase
MRTSFGFGGDSFDDSECDRTSSEYAADCFGPAQSDDASHDDDSDVGIPQPLNLDGVSLKRLFPSASFFQCDDIVADSLALCLANLIAGELCIYRTGESDPVEFSGLALAQGACGILTDQLLPCPLPQVIVGDVETAACDLMNELNQHPSKQMMMIGVVGNAGKTTTALMVTGVLRALGIRAAYETDLGSSDGIVQTVEPKCVAKGAELVARLSEASDAGCGAAVVEFTSEVAAAHSGIAFDLLVVTGSSASSDSLDQSKHHFGPDPLMIALDHLAQDGVVIVPADHPKLLRRVDDAGHKRLTYGLRREADISAKVFDNQPGEMTLMVSCGDETAAMETKHCGEAMAMNQLAAIAVALLLESRLHEAVETVSRLPVVPGRMQRVTGFDSAAVVIDAAGDWSRIASTLRTLRQQRGNGKLWCVMTLAEGSQTAINESLALSGRMIEKYSDRVILTSTKEAKPTFLHNAHALLDGFREVTVARLVADQRRAIQWALDHAMPQDTVVVLGGLDGETAVERRTNIRSLEQLIERCQQSPSVKRYVGPATIPMPGVASKL